MNKNLMIILAVTAIAVALLPRKEPYRRELFGNSGYSPPKTVKLDDDGADLAGYEEVEDLKVTPDLMNKIIMATNGEIAKRTGLSTYIIQTHALKKYVGKGSGETMYQAMFMVAAQTGFSYGFNVVSELTVAGGDMSVTSLRTQPLGVQAPTNVAPYVAKGNGQEFVDYRLVQQMTPTEPQLQEAKRSLDALESDLNNVS